MIGCLRVRKQPIIALYFESENELELYNLEARCAKPSAYQSGNVSIPIRCFTICKTVINPLCTYEIFLLV